MKKLVLIGVGGFGREVAWLVERINKVNATWEIIGFVDDNEKLHGSIVEGYPVLGDCNWLKKQKAEIYAICTIGCSVTRKKVIDNLKEIRFPTLIDPSVQMSDNISVGEGCIICAGSIITVDIKIGAHVIINLNSTIGHDVILKDFVTLYPAVNVSGNVILGECAELGTGCQIIQGLKIAAFTIIGAGAVVIKDIINPATYVGVPARRVNK